MCESPAKQVTPVPAGGASVLHFEGQDFGWFLYEIVQKINTQMNLLKNVIPGFSPLEETDGADLLWHGYDTLRWNPFSQFRFLYQLA